MTPDSGDGSPQRDSSGTEDEPPYEEVVESLFAPEFREIGLAKTRALSTVIASIQDENHRTPWPLQKFCVKLYFDGAPQFGPITTDMEGPVSVDQRELLAGMERAGILESKPSKLTNGSVCQYKIAPRYQDNIIASEEWGEKANTFFKNVNVRKPFMEVNPSDPRSNDYKYDKSKFYPKILNQEAHIGIDEQLVATIKDGSNQLSVNDEIVEVLNENPPRRIRDEFDEAFWPVANLEYYLLSRWKHLYPYRGGASSDDVFREASRKFRVRELNRQLGNDVSGVEGDSCFPWGYFDLWSERYEYTGPNEYVLKEGLISDNCVRIRFDGQLDMPKQDLYDYNVGVLGIVESDGGEPLVRGLSMLRFRRLPAQVLDVQDRNRDKLHVELYNDDREYILSILSAIEAHDDVEGQTRETVIDYKQKVKKGLEEIHGINLIVELVHKYPELESVVMEILRNPPF